VAWVGAVAVDPYFCLSVPFCEVIIAKANFGWKITKKINFENYVKSSNEELILWRFSENSFKNSMEYPRKTNIKKIKQPESLSLVTDSGTPLRQLNIQTYIVEPGLFP